MTGRAIPRGWLVEQNRLGADNSRQLVALRAAHILMRTSQRKLRSLVMIEERRLPFHAVVTLRATGHIRFRELLSVDVLMAVLALCRRSFEIHIKKIGFQVGRLVAVHARRRAMRP